jgi:hypothetical protein
MLTLVYALSIDMTFFYCNWLVLKSGCREETSAMTVKPVRCRMGVTRRGLLPVMRRE